MSIKKISEGAEANVYEKKAQIVKVRPRKTYRLQEIDEVLRKSRTRREAKILETLKKANFPAPILLDLDESSMTITMSKIPGRKLRDALEKEDYRVLSQKLGILLAKLHNLGIIHSDPTTSNVMFNPKTQGVSLIDFGLSYFSEKAEDKAVDLHLLRQALESKHYTIWKECFKEILTVYRKNAQHSGEILERLSDVELRGRNKAK
jgi:Kae1-associated kinase Bud32